MFCLPFIPGGRSSHQRKNQLFPGLMALKIAQQSRYVIRSPLRSSIAHELIILEHVGFLPHVFIDTFPNNLLGNTQLWYKAPVELLGSYLDMTSRLSNNIGVLMTASILLQVFLETVTSSSCFPTAVLARNSSPSSSAFFWTAFWKLCSLLRLFLSKVYQIWSLFGFPLSTSHV